MRPPTENRLLTLVTTISVVSAALSSGVRSLTAQTPPADPQRILADHGLTLSGDAWLCVDEVELRRALDALDPAERRHQALQQAVDEHIRRNEAARRELADKRRELANVRKSIETASPATLGPTRDKLKQAAAELSTRIKQLRKDYKDGDHLAEHPPVRDDAIRLGNARATLTIAAATVRKRLDSLPGAYESLRNSADVQAALRKLGPTQRLGSDRDYAADAAKRLARVDRTLQSDVVSAFRDDGHVRFVGVVNDTTPVTFSMRESDGPTHLPHSVVASLGISIDNAPETKYTVDAKRTLICRKITLDRVQVGNAVMKNVRALALPPEGEDLGAKLGKSAYEDHYFEVDLTRLRMTNLHSPPPTEAPPAKKATETTAPKPPGRTSGKERAPGAK